MILEQSRRGMFGRGRPVVMPGAMGGTFAPDGAMQRGFLPPVGYPASLTGGRPFSPGPLGDGQTMEEATTLGETKTKPGFFADGGTGQKIAGFLGPALLTLGGNPAVGLQATEMIARNRQRAIDALAAKIRREQDRKWQVEDREWKASQPDYFTVGRDRVKLNPKTGETQVVYDGPEDFDEYATAMGLEPGSDEYEGAVLDYVLRGHGPTALNYDKQLDDYRTANDKGYDDYRTRNRLKVRGTPTYRDKNPLPPRSVRKPAAPAVKATNPKTGEVITLNSRGQWVDKDGRPVQ